MATIRIISKVPVVQSALKARPLRVAIDGGEEQELSLSKPNDVDVQAGNHHVEMYVAWALPARMGPADDPMAVVDQHCQVRTIPNLRVVDASVMPAIPRANINLTCIMIAEHVSDWMRDEA